MARTHLRRRVAGARTVARTAVTANAPRRLRRAAGDVPAAELDTTTSLPELDLSIPPWPGADVEVAGTRLFVRSTPTTADTPVPTAVYVHGLGGASTNWTDLAHLLRPFVEGLAPDLPGFGRSGPAATGEYSIRAHARVVTAYLEQVVAERGGPVHLFGNSMGGAISIRVAARRPDLVRSLTLISPAVPDLRVRRDDDPRAALMLVPGVARTVQKRMATVTPRQQAKAMVRLCFGDPDRVPEHRIEEAAAEIEVRSGYAWGQSAFAASMKGLVASWFSATPWNDLAAVTAPTLVLWGDRDKLVDPALAPRVAAAVPRARLLVLAGVGHVAQIEDAVTTARAWLGTVGRRSVHDTTDARVSGLRGPSVSS